MKAMIFAAGMGTRLRPLTDHQPKALVPVGGIPMLERIIIKLKTSGFTDITINIHHLGEQIIDFLKANRNFGVDIHLSDERGLLLDTGGGIRKARPFLEGNEPFLVHNVDILSDIDLTKLYRQHLQSHADATLLTGERKTSRYLLFNTENRLCGWTNKTTGEFRPDGFEYNPAIHQALAFNGIHVLSPRLFDFMDEEVWNGKFSIIPFYLSICHDAFLQSYTLPDSQWFDIGKPETLQLAEQTLLS